MNHLLDFSYIQERKTKNVKGPNKPASSTPLWKTALQLFFFGGITMSLIFLLLGGYTTINNFIRNSIFNGFIWIILGIGNGIVNDKISTYISWMENPIKRTIWGVIGMMAYTIVSVGIFYFIWAKIVFGRSFLHTYNSISIEFFYSVLVITLIVGLFLHGRSFLIHWQASALEAERLKRENLSARYETLKNQVNPHFLFNSFNVLSTLVYKDQDLAAKFIKKMSDSYRYVLETKDQEAVPLSTELDALQSFIFLSKIRFGENLSVNLNVAPQPNKMVAPLSLQMLLENAIKHNVVSRARPLSVDVFEDQGYIVVRNNLQRKNNVTDSAGIGLPNIQARYQYLTDQAVIINETADSFEVRLPLFELEA